MIGEVTIGEIVWTGRYVTPPKRVASPTLGPPPPCKQALNQTVS